MTVKKYFKTTLFSALLMVVSVSLYAQDAKTLEGKKFSENLETLSGFTGYFQSIERLYLKEDAFDPAKFLQTKMKLEELFQNDIEAVNEKKSYVRQYNEIAQRVTEAETVSLTRSRILDFSTSIESFIDEYGESADVVNMAKGGRNNRQADHARAYIRAKKNLKRAIEWDVFVLGFAFAPEQPTYKEYYRKALVAYNKHIGGPGGKLGIGADMTSYLAQAKAALEEANNKEAASEAAATAALNREKQARADKKSLTQAATKAETKAYSAKKAAEEAYKVARKAAKKPADPGAAKIAAEDAEAAAIDAEKAAKVAATDTYYPDKGQRAAEHATAARKFADDARRHAESAAQQMGLEKPVIQSTTTPNSETPIPTSQVIDAEKSSSGFGLISLSHTVLSILLIVAGMILGVAKSNEDVENIENTDALMKFLGVVSPLSVPIGVAVMLLSLFTFVIDLRFLQPLIANGVPQIAGFTSGLLLAKDTPLLSSINAICNLLAPKLEQLLDANITKVGLLCIAAGVAHLLFSSSYLI